MRLRPRRQIIDVASPPAGLAVRKDPQRLRLERAEKERDQLLRTIGTKRRSQERSQTEAREAAIGAYARTAPLERTALAVATEIRATFEHLLARTSPLTKATKQNVRALYQALTQLLPTDNEADVPSKKKRARPGKARDEGAEEDTPEHPSAEKPTDQGQLLRATFRRLAIALHPDRTTDPEEKAARTETMKEITRAFERADIARLVEFERTLLVKLQGNEESDTARHIELLEEGNRELRRQLRTLTEETKKSRDNAQLLHVEDGVDHWVQALTRDVQSLTSIRDLLGAFREGTLDEDGLFSGVEEALDQREQPKRQRAPRGRVVSPRRSSAGRS